MGKEQSFQQMVLGQLAMPMEKKRNLDSYLIPHTKINLEGIVCLTIRAKVIEPLKENIENLCDFGVAKDFLASKA